MKLDHYSVVGINQSRSEYAFQLAFDWKEKVDAFAYREPVILSAFSFLTNLREILHP